MAINDSKKYYWLKLKEDFFEEDTISWLEEQDNGVYYSNFYLKLCLKSLKTGGVLIRNVGEILIPYDISKLAEITRVNKDTAIVAMELFKKIGLVQILENGEIYLSQLNNMVGAETKAAERMRKSRANKQLKASPSDKCNNVTPMLQECSPEKEIEIEKEIEKDIDIDIEKERETEKRKRVDYQRIVDMYNDTCVSFPKVHSISDARKKAIKARLNTYSVYDFKILFKKAESSDFLKGKNARNWSANFDWLIKDANMAKVLDGNYDGVQAYSGGGASQSDDSTSQKQLAALMERQEQLNAEYAKQKHDEDYF